jgi:ATP-dependent Clp protease ATP-binding subunit ClpC
VDFSNTIIVMTSNIGAEKLTKQAARIGFKLEEEAREEESAYEEKCKEVLAELKDHLRPEFLNRIDHVIVFNALNQQHIRRIVKMHVDQLASRLKEQGYELKVDPQAIQLLAEEGFDPEYGARPVRRVIQERLEAEIAEHILKEIFRPGDVISVSRKDKENLEFLRGDKAEVDTEVKQEEVTV